MENSAPNPALPPDIEKLPFLQRSLFKFLRVFFQLLYHQFAWSYDIVAATVSLGQWKTWVLSVLPYLSGPRVLELGHGPGHLQAAMHERGLQPVGLDESRQFGRVAIKRLRSRNFNYLLVNGYAQFMPFQTGTLNQVVATFPSEYITHPSTLAEIYRVLTPGGTLLILPLAWITGRSLPHRLAARLFTLTGQAPNQATVVNHPRAAAPFRAAGFQVRMELIQHPASTLLLIHAVKPGLPE